jgi:hypothetical protein
VSGWTVTLLDGLAAELAAAGIATWKPSGVYAAGETGIVLRAIPPAPDRLITLAPYRVGDDYPGMADFVQAVQIRLRGTADPRSCDDMADQVFELLDSREQWTCGGIPVVYSRRQSDSSLGADDRGRWEASHNYYFDVMRPTAHRTI